LVPFLVNVANVFLVDIVSVFLGGFKKLGQVAVSSTCDGPLQAVLASQYGVRPGASARRDAPDSQRSLTTTTSITITVILCQELKLEHGKLFQEVQLVGIFAAAAILRGRCTKYRHFKIDDI
jgi:hypothetical protein